jgi:transcriptional regulator with XRE-family HTH domain
MKNEYSDLRQIRKAAGDSLDDIARRTGISIGYLHRIERGFVTEIKDKEKRKSLSIYIHSARQRAKSKLTKTIEVINS